MAFTKTHYEKIADMIHKLRTEISADATLTNQIPGDTGWLPSDIEAKLAVVNQFTVALKDLFKQDNPKFKEFTFIGACNRDLLDK
jgi:hypothetical protein